MNIFLDVLQDTVSDSLHMLPFLFAAFLLIETLEHYSTTFINQALLKINKAGPLVGAILGCIPQCGFSVMSANLYSSGVVSLGTMLAVFLATSDEAILLLLGHPESAGSIWTLLAAKLLIAVIAGYITDLFLAKRISTPKHFGDLCDHCGCHEHHGIVLPAFKHTLKLFAYIFVFSGLLNLIIAYADLNTLSTILLSGSLLQPFLAALIGFIPNCAASVVLTELYLSGTLSFASVVAGLCTNAGVGLVVLFEVDKNRKEDLKIVGLLYFFAVAAGLILSIF